MLRAAASLRPIASSNRLLALAVDFGFKVGLAEFEKSKRYVK